MLGVSRTAIWKRARLGEQVLARVNAARAAGALVRLADVRAERAEAMARAGVQDRTGSDREQAAGAG